MYWTAFIIIGYLCGSVPFALLLGMARGVDIRKVGSGNVGATNLGRAIGRKWGVACFLLDALKGLAPVAVAGALAGLIGARDIPAGAQLGWMAVAAAAIAGHVFPVWLKFKGGKGVATGFGAMLGFWPLLTLPAVGALAAWGVVTMVTRYIGLASVVGALLMPVFLIATATMLDATVLAVLPMLAVVSLLAVLVVVRHWSNLVRLAKGTESKIGAPLGSPDDLPGSLEEVRRAGRSAGDADVAQPDVPDVPEPDLPNGAKPS